jgi:hypothetical protein
MVLGTLPIKPILGLTGGVLAYLIRKILGASFWEN